MRIWDLPPAILCRNHLLGEHRELHCIWNVITKGRKGYSRHPETLRWNGKLKALYLRHDKLVEEIVRRGYKHNSPIDKELTTGSDIQDVYVDSIERQRELLRIKGCGCKVEE